MYVAGVWYAEEILGRSSEYSLSSHKCPASAVGHKTPDELWFGKASGYSYLKIFGCRAYAHVKQDKLEARALRCVFIGYPKGVKGYKMWCTEPDKQKVIISRDVVFKENEMPYLMQKTEQHGSVTKDGTSGLKVEFERNISDEGQETKADVELEQEGINLEDCILARDRTRRTVKQPARFSGSDMLYFALNVVENIDCEEPKNYKEAISCEESRQWILAMREELESLEKNGTWILVDKPKNQKLVSCKWLFKKKAEMTDREMIRYKARLVARGFTQREGVDFN